MELKSWLVIVVAALENAVEKHARVLDAENKRQSASLCRLLEAGLAEAVLLAKLSSESAAPLAAPPPPNPPPKPGMVMDTDPLEE